MRGFPPINQSQKISLAKENKKFQRSVSKKIISLSLILVIYHYFTLMFKNPSVKKGLNISYLLLLRNFIVNSRNHQLSKGVVSKFG